MIRFYYIENLFEENVNNTIINNFKTLVEFLGNVMGSNTEIVLHELSDYEHSIIAISNNLSNRRIGGPLTDFALKILKQSKQSKKDFFINYKGKSNDGKMFRSSTMFIRDEEGEPMAMLCMNIDISEFDAMKSTIDKLLNGEHSSTAFDFEQEFEEITENINPSIEDLTSSIVQKIVAQTEVAPNRMTKDEKLEIIRELNDEGVFLLKGAVKEVAPRINSSEATVYRYLSIIE